MQAHERVGLEPVAPDTVAAVDEGDAHVGVVDQGVGERHAHGPGPDHEVVGLDSARHEATQARARPGVHHCPRATYSRCTAVPERPSVAPLMTSHLAAFCFDANDPLRLARFWAGVLDREMVDDPDGGFALLPSDDTEFRIEFFPTEEPKVGPNQMHLHLTSTSLDDQQATVGGCSGSAAGTSTSASARRRSTWCSPTPRATSSA